MIFLTRLSATCNNSMYYANNINLSVSEFIRHLPDGGWSGVRASKLSASLRIAKKN